MGTFDRGLEGFRKVKDKKNEVVVLMNMTRLHKIAAQVHITSMAQTTKQFCGPARHHFEEVCISVLIPIMWTKGENV